MKKTIILAAACLALGACSHRQTRQEQADANRANGVTVTTTTTATPPVADRTTTSGSSSSLGAVSSGRGH